MLVPIFKVKISRKETFIRYLGAENKTKAWEEAIRLYEGQYDIEEISQVLEQH